MLKGVKRNVNTVDEKLTELKVLLLQNPYIIHGKLHPPPPPSIDNPQLLQEILDPPSDFSTVPTHYKNWRFTL